MGCVFGDFMPTENYYSNVQKLVWSFNSTNKPDYTKWKALNINVQLENGYFLHPAGGYTFDDIEAYSNETIRINVAGLFGHVIEDFFRTESKRLLIEGPWETISIEQKILFENELQKEIKRHPGSFFGWIKPTTEHILSGYECAAICKFKPADDILFAIHKNGSDEMYAVVHLTFSGKKEENIAFPSTTLYDSFDAFKAQRMYPDKAEWEESL